MASRLFACFSLYCDTQALNNAVFVPSPRKRPRRQDSAASKILVSLNTILPLLQALVDLEVALLDEKNGESKSRRVHFAAFDGSALQPPSDVMEHSHVHNQAAIDGLVTVLESVDTLRNTSGIESRQLLKSLVDYLTATFDKHGHSFLCAQSMSNAEMKFPVQRVHKAAARYSADFQQLLSDSWWNKLEDFPLSWNCRLADATAQLVRYWLRTELNPVPDRAASQKYSKKWNNRVYNILTLEKASQSTETDTIVNDGSLSSLVSNAASHVCCYFGNDWKEWKASVDATPLDFFELTELCQKGIAPASPSKHRRRSGPMLNFYTADDWERITHHIEVATTFLAAVNRAKFLYDLLTIVSQHSEHQASWHKTIQQSAQKLERCGRDSLLKDDIHLLLLRWSPLTLLDQLPILIDWKRKRSCEKFLEEIPNKFLLGKIDAKKTRRKKAYEPYIGVFEGVYERGMSKVAFPSVRRLHVPMAKSSWLASP